MYLRRCREEIVQSGCVETEDILCIDKRGVKQQTRTIILLSTVI
jgi:hypothetical protein